jgi:eukaryotic-like serine/threonine-protein kinase
MSTVQEQLSASLAGRYRIERELGSGGMATVYLARDLRHDRLVALKVMKSEIVATVGADRFVREIRTTAGLKHPHILPLFDSGDAGSALFYVMPYIDGESLRARIRRDGALPVGETVRILRDVADGLAYAHAQDVVHRDVKPDNVLLSGSHAFLADFGIARALESAGPADQTMTATAVVAGTPVYMSPEQIAGQRHLDHRADVYAFGVMAYEMLAGVPPFEGTAASVLTAHLTGTPVPLSSRRRDIPPALSALVMKCLEKKPEDRWQHTSDVLAALTALAAPGDTGPSTRAMVTTRGLALTLGSAAAIAILAFVAWQIVNTRSVSLPLTIGSMKHITRDPGLELDPAISPDGRTVAYAAGPPGKRRLYIRQIEDGRPIALTEEGVAESQRRPDWSPDGTRIVFQAGQQGLGVRPAARTGTLYTVPALGGTPTLLLPPSPDGVALTPVWSPDGTRIAYAGEAGLFLIPAQPGGTPTPILRSRQNLHSPRWSPDGLKLVYVRGGAFFALGEDQLGNVETSAIHVVVIATGADQTITTGEWLDTSPAWTADGRGLLFVSNRSGGRDVFHTRVGGSGTPEGPVDRVTSGLNAHSISLSKDGKVLAYSSLTFRANIWSAPIRAKGVATTADATQITFGSEKTEKLVLSPDGQWLAYDSDRSGNPDIWKLRLGNAEPQQVTRDPANEFANDWSPSGDQILFHAIRGETRRDVLAVTADGTRLQTVVATPAEEQHGSWSPDGHRIAFSGGDTIGERYDVHVTTRPNKDAPWGAPRRLTTASGVDPKWSPDGRSILYVRRGEVHLIDADGSNDRPLVSGLEDAGPALAQYAVWSRDGRTVYVKAASNERRATIWSVPVAGGAPRLIMRFDDPSRPSLRREFATDGTRLYFTIAQDESDVWIVEIK